MMILENKVKKNTY